MSVICVHLKVVNSNLERRYTYVCDINMKLEVGMHVVVLYLIFLYNTCSLLVYDYDMISSDDFLGSTTIPLRRCLHSEKMSFELPLKSDYPVSIHIRIYKYLRRINTHIMYTIYYNKCTYYILIHWKFTFISTVYKKLN